MKQLSLLLLMCITLTVNAQDTTVTSVTGTDVELLVDKYSNKIEATIVSLAESLKQPAEYVYGVLIKEQYVKAIVKIAIILLTFIGALISYLILKAKDDFDELYGISLTLILLAIFFAIIFAKSIISGFMNPDYGAMKDIVDLIS